ncbi:hypothetical protein EPN28_00285 [Patescibacteria group bacterium]|nr:MAG: hypothetical protein EPN28_00285 [Patescibacteria group bacterium]
MIIDLNLLPPPKKNRLRYIVRFIFTKDILEITLFVCAVIALSLIWSWVVLQESFTQLALSAAAVDREFASYNQETKKLNKTIKGLTMASKGYTPALPKIMELINSLPGDIKLNYLRLDRKSAALNLSGTAKSRAALLNYQKILSSVPWVERIDIPVSQLFQKENINFEIKAGLKLPKLPGAPDEQRQAAPAEDDI